MSISFSKMDQKFTGVIVKAKNNKTVTVDQWVVFLAKDAAFPAALAAYEEECIRLGCGQAQIEAVRAMRARVDEWQKEYPDLVKIPDVDPGELLPTK